MNYTGPKKIILSNSLNRVRLHQNKMICRINLNKIGEVISSRIMTDYYGQIINILVTGSYYILVFST